MNDKDQLCLIYASIVSFQFHPGKKQGRLSAREVMDLALEYFNELKRTEEALWPGLDR